MNALRKIAAGSLAAVLACSMAACGSGNANSTDSASNTGKTVKVDEKSAKATSISDFGGMDGLVAAAEKEGALNVIALPHDWSNYGDVISGFKKKYPKIKINEQNPNASSKEEVDAGKTNKGTDAAPDVYDLGLAVASTSTDNFASYKVQAWDKIPDSVKDKDGKYYADYTGIMSIGWNADKYGDIKSINDLTDPKFAGTVALNGKPAEAGAAFNGYLMINQLAGGDIKNLQPGLDFFKKLKDCGNLTTVDVTDGTIDSGQTGVVMDWTYNQASYQKSLKAKGVNIGYVTLHVGLGTFRPVKEDEITDHEMHSEYCVISQETADLINRTKANGGRCICVGTTSCRTLESWAAEDGHMEAKAGWTNIYIYPGYRFKVMDGLVTNFHLPESTLIMLVSAFAGREHVLAAYEEAVREKYRFFSFGDAMFLR